MENVITRGNACLILVEKVMERDCILGQGAACFERDRLTDCSDKFKMWFCDVCGIQAHVENGGEIRECKICGTNKCSLRIIPYGTKLVNQEFMASNIIPRVLCHTHERSVKDTSVADE